MTADTPNLDGLISYADGYLVDATHARTELSALKARVAAAENTRLMTAAPALYDALCELVGLNSVIDIDRTPEWLRAIAKAEKAIELAR